LISLKKEFFKTSLLGLTIGAVVIGILYLFITKVVIENELKKARLEAKTIIAYRHYLALVSPKVKVVDTNLSPFAITPAFTTNQVAKILRDEGVYIKQTSDRYRNILDKPNESELEAINFFKTHKDKEEFFQIHNADKNFKEKHLFYARKLVIEKSCLKCHGIPGKDVPLILYKELTKYYGNKAFNYHLGDVRGIISIVFPYEKILKNIDKIFLIVIGIGVLFFLVGLFIFYKLNMNINKDISKVLNHFKLTQKGKYPIFKEKLKFLEFANLKDEINKTFLRLRRYEGELYKELYFNNLTLLPNRNKFLDLIKDKKYVIALLNIDKFKDINFYFGVDIANKLILEVSKRLKNLKKKYNFKLFHINIDEFALLFNNIDENTLREEIKEILKELEKPYNIDGNEIIIRFRAGISFKKKDYIRANIALDMAKELKKDILFGKEIEGLGKYKEHLQWLRKLKWALENDRIIPFYQPIVDANGKMVKYEALVRLIDENGRVVSPFFFLDVAKKSRMYLEITKRVIDKAIEKIKEKNVAISINLTLEDINDEDMRKFIFEKISSIKDKTLLTFEIVESEDVGENKKVKEFLRKIKSLGSLIYIDDFGSGYSNFDYLIKLNPDGVKIDGSIIKNILTDKNNEIITKTIISFAKEMNIKTIAEYVENKEIFDKLKNLGVDYFQGYYFSAPKEDI